MSAIYAALSAVMKDVGAVKKGDRNTVQNFMFRGVDAVVNAVYPALIEHGVTVQPNVRSYDYGTVEVGQGERRKPMGHARVVVEYTFTSTEDGSAVTASAAGEAMDSGDKATPKAMSVALRTALLQSLMLPTDDPEPDAHTYERAAAVDPIVEARVAVKDAWEANRGVFDREAVEEDFMNWAQGELLSNATAERLYQYADALKGEQGA
jgi:hypothetical protein